MPRQRNSDSELTRPGRLSQAPYGAGGSGSRAWRSRARRSPIVSPVTPQPCGLAPAALSREIIVQRLDALNPRNRHEEVPPDEAGQPLDLALVIALARPAEPVLEQTVGLQLREDARSLPLSIAQDAGNRQSGVVVQDGAGDAAEERNPALWPSQNASVVSAG